MDAAVLTRNIKQKCRDKGISVSQLEKEVGFSTGSIGKWGQSSPSIEKVMAVAEYFQISLDEICGLYKSRQETEFMECLIRKTNEGELVWEICFSKEVGRIGMDIVKLEEDTAEMYTAEYGTGKIYLGYSQDKFELYISLENSACVKQHEDIEQMRKLWELIKEKEHALKVKIDEFKREFVCS